MIAFLQNVLWSTRWSYVGIMTLISLILGFIWYSKILFGPSYMKWMRLWKEKEKDPSMLRPLVYEVISRIVYFMWLWWILVTLNRWLDFDWVFPIAIVMWLLFVLSTQLSQTVWSPVNKKVLRIIAGNSLLQTIIATRIFLLMIR